MWMALGILLVLGALVLIGIGIWVAIEWRDVDIQRKIDEILENFADIYP